MKNFDLNSLETIIHKRSKVKDGSSYTAKLLDKGVSSCAQKFGEEAIETVIACISQNRKNLIAESADLLYHFLVMLKAANIPISEIFAELQLRTSQSGLQEKLSRKNFEN